MAYKLAYAAGRADVDEFINEITPEEFDGWCEMENLIPFGEEKLAWVMAAGFATLANISLATAFQCPKKIEEIVKPRDLIPWLKKSKRRKRETEHINPNQAAAMFRAAVQGK